MDSLTRISEAEAEVFIDRAVQWRLSIDHAYKFAPNPKVQAERERVIEAEEAHRIYSKYEVL